MGLAAYRGLAVDAATLLDLDARPTRILTPAHRSKQKPTCLCADKGHREERLLGENGVENSQEVEEVQVEEVQEVFEVSKRSRWAWAGWLDWPRLGTLFVCCASPGSLGPPGP